MTKKNKEQRIYESLKNGSVLTVCYQNEEGKTAEAVGVITQVTDEYIIVKQTYENQSWLTLIWQKAIYEVR